MKDSSATLVTHVNCLAMIPLKNYNWSAINIKKVNPQKTSLRKCKDIS